MLLRKDFKATCRLTVLTVQVQANVHNDGSPEELLKLVDECIPLAQELELGAAVIKSMYATRARALQCIELQKKACEVNDEVDQHNYLAMGAAMRNYMSEKEPSA